MLQLKTCSCLIPKELIIDAFTQELEPPAIPGTAHPAQLKDEDKPDQISNLNPLNGAGYALADTDAHGGECELAASLNQLQRGAAGNAGARHAQRMAEGDGAAIGVYVLAIIGQAQLPQHGKALGGKRLVQFDHVEV